MGRIDRRIFTFFAVLALLPRLSRAAETTAAYVPFSSAAGAQAEILEHAARYYAGLDCHQTEGCTVLTDPTVPHYNVDSMAGLSYRIDPTREVGHRVRDVRIRGRAIDLHREFTLVCNNYRAAGGGGYPHLAGAVPVWHLGLFIVAVGAVLAELPAAAAQAKRLQQAGGVGPKTAWALTAGTGRVLPPGGTGAPVGAASFR